MLFSHLKCVCVCMFVLVFFLLLFLTAVWLATSRVDSLSLIPSSFPLTLVVFVVDYSSTHMFRSLALYPLLLQLLPVLKNCHTLRERDATPRVQEVFHKSAHNIGQRLQGLLCVQSQGFTRLLSLLRWSLWFSIVGFTAKISVTCYHCYHDVCARFPEVTPRSSG